MGNQTAGGNNSANHPSDMQKTFITMLFAFAVSVVAQQIAEVLTVMTESWGAPHNSPQPLGNSIVVHLTAVLMHSLLALLMLSVSWIMWSRSKAAGHIDDIKEIFSVKFITFILEVLLVTLYFSLAKSAEGDFSAYSKEKSVASYLTSASARPEALQMFFIFTIFFIWDYIVDVLRSPQDPAITSPWPWLCSQLTGIATYCSISILCALGALAIYYAVPHSHTPAQAIAGDIGLVMLLLFFNQAKVLENYLFRLFPKEATRKNSRRPISIKSIMLTILLFLGWGNSLFVMSIL